MGRPSYIFAEISEEDGEISEVCIGGDCCNLKRMNWTR